MTFGYWTSQVCCTQRNSQAPKGLDRNSMSEQMTGGGKSLVGEAPEGNPPKDVPGDPPSLAAKPILECGRVWLESSGVLESSIGSG